MWLSKIPIRNLQSHRAVSEVPLDSDSEEVASLALRCLAHMFTWIQLSSNVSSRLLAVVFRFASSPPHGDSQSGSELATLAMGAINEIMYRNCVPADFESFLLQLFRDTFHLLQVRANDVMEHVFQTIRPNLGLMLEIPIEHSFGV